MKFEVSKKTLIIIASSLWGLILLWGLLSVVGHGNYDRDDSGKFFGTPGCTMGQWNSHQIMSGMENIIATKDYVAFQKLFSGSRMLDTINTPEKFATRVELQTTMKTAQDLAAKLWSGTQGGFGPMMFDGQQKWSQGCPMMGGRWNERWNERWAMRWNMMRRK